MVADSLLNRLGNWNCFVQSFADDVVILIGGKFFSTICDLIKRALNCVQTWCGEIGLNVNADKTYMVLFIKKEELGRFLRHKTLYQVKYLRVILDSILTQRNNHVKFTKKFVS
jgi:hypothetical protein